MSMQFHEEKPKDKKVVQIDEEKKRLDVEQAKQALTPEQQKLLENCDLTTGPSKGGTLGLLTGSAAGHGGGGAFFCRAITGRTPEGRIEITFNPNASGSSDTIWSAKGKVEGKKISDEEALKLAYKYRAIAEFQTEAKN